MPERLRHTEEGEEEEEEEEEKEEEESRQKSVESQLLHPSTCCLTQTAVEAQRAGNNKLYRNDNKCRCNSQWEESVLFKKQKEICIRNMVLDASRVPRYTRALRQAPNAGTHMLALTAGKRAGGASDCSLYSYASLCI
jgi:hypothetical protein